MADWEQPQPYWDSGQIKPSSSRLGSHQSAPDDDSPDETLMNYSLLQAKRRKYAELSDAIPVQSAPLGQPDEDELFELNLSHDVTEALITASNQLQIITPSRPDSPTTTILTAGLDDDIDDDTLGTKEPKKRKSSFNGLPMKIADVVAKPVATRSGRVKRPPARLTEDCARDEELSEAIREGRTRGLYVAKSDPTTFVSASGGASFSSSVQMRDPTVATPTNYGQVLFRVTATPTVAATTAGTPPGTSKHTNSEKTKRRFTPAEDEQLRVLVSSFAELDAVNWRWVADQLGRTSARCRERYKFYLAEGASASQLPWTREEDQILINFDKKSYKNPYKHLSATLLPGRNEKAIYNRYKLLINHGLISTDPKPQLQAHPLPQPQPQSQPPPRQIPQPPPSAKGKRPRGRPHKRKAEVDLNVVSNFDSDEQLEEEHDTSTPAKTRRGRPKKVSTAAVIKAAEAALEAVNNGYSYNHEPAHDHYHNHDYDHNYNNHNYYTSYSYDNDGVGDGDDDVASVDEFEYDL